MDKDFKEGCLGPLALWVGIWLALGLLVFGWIWLTTDDPGPYNPADEYEQCMDDHDLVSYCSEVEEEAWQDYCREALTYRESDGYRQDPDWYDNYYADYDEHRELCRQYD